MEKEKKGVFKHFLSKRKKTIAILAITLGNAFAVSTVSFAWFCISTNTASTIETFSGDLDVSIEKITAYKYVYPYQRNSTDFVDYEAAGAVKSYVVEDASIELEGTLSNTVTIALGTTTEQTYATSASDASIGPTKVHYERSQDFKYYLLGNDIFTGINTNAWSTLTATCFSSRQAPTVDTPVTVDNVVVSAGAEFLLFDANTIDGANCSYFTYTSITPETNKVSRFSLLDSNRIKCLKSGIYQFQYRVEVVNEVSSYYLDINLVSRSDNAIIGSNMIDPTKITIDYRGQNYAEYDSITQQDLANITSLETFLPYAIQEQKTMVVLDVKLKYQNKNAIDAGLIVKREAQSAQSIYGFTGKYSTTDSYTYQGYVDSTHRNPLKASDFYAFYFEFAKESNAYANGAAAWNALHANKTNYQVNSEYQFAKFQNNTSFDQEINGTLHPKTNTDSIIVPGSATDNIYHCYIALDYDYEYMRFFVDQNRVGKTYYLDRDFGFHFTAIQHVEPAPQQGGQGDQYEKEYQISYCDDQPCLIELGGFTSLNVHFHHVIIC